MGKKLDRREFLKVAGASVGGALLSATAVAAAGGQNRTKSMKNVPNGAAMLYDATKCIGCRACQTACRRANHKPPELDPTGKYDEPKDLSGDTWLLIKLYKENDDNWTFLRRACMHCIEPACVAACPLGALHITPEGAVAYDTNICFGCRYCMVSCPFEVPRYEWGVVKPYIQKCDLCASNGRLGSRKKPACAEACPTNALQFGTRGELLQEAHKRIQENPDKYLDHVYGEHEVGGTHILYLSSVPFDKQGLPQVGNNSYPEKVKIPMDYAVPSIMVGVTALMTGAYYATSGNDDEEGRK